jgi:hypothetical protein
MMYVECTKGFCPCTGACTNQRFQKADYPLIRPFKAGNTLKLILISADWKKRMGIESTRRPETRAVPHRVCRRSYPYRIMPKTAREQKIREQLLFLDIGWNWMHRCEIERGVCSVHQPQLQSELPDTKMVTAGIIFLKASTKVCERRN